MQYFTILRYKLLFRTAGLKCRSQVTGQVTGYRPQATGQVTGHRSQVRLQATSHRPQIRSQVTKNNRTLDKTVLD